MFPILIYILTFFDLKSDVFSTKIIHSFINGDAYQTNKIINNTIELRIDSENINYKKTESTQATEILKVFFKKYPASTFVINQKGDLLKGSSYFIGKYKATSGHQFQVYIIAKKALNQQILIETLQIRNLKKGF